MKNRRNNNESRKAADDRVIVATEGTFDAEKAGLSCCGGAATLRT